MTVLREKIHDEQILNLISLWIKMGRVDKSLQWKDSFKGVPLTETVHWMFSEKALFYKGRAPSVYWQLVKPLFDESLEFEGRIKMWMRRIFEKIFQESFL